jgi:predicted transcriptional regulator of viral defense system
MWITTQYETESASPPLNRAIAALARSQHGVVALDQLKAMGLSEAGVRSRVARGTLHRLHRGVYSVGHPVVSMKGRWLAAVLSCGPGAVLSHSSAASLWGFQRTDRAEIDVTVERSVGRSRPGITAHVVRRLDRADRALTHGVPCTTVARTLLDLADVLTLHRLERACERAEMLQLFDAREVEGVLSRAAGRRGASKLRAIVEEGAVGASTTESELEERFLELCSAAGLPRPRVNAWVNFRDGAVKVDFLWPAEKLIVEADGRQVHGTRRAFETDRRRDQRLMLAGYRVVRCTWRQLTEQPQGLVATISSLLDA